MAKKKLVFITPQLYPQAVGGIEVFNYYLIQELAADGYDVSYLTAADGDLKSAVKIKLKGTYSILQLFQIIIFLIKKYASYDLIVTSFARTRWYYVVIYPILNFVFTKDYIIVIHGGGLMQWKWRFPYQLYFKKAKAVVGVSTKICDEYKKRTGIDLIHIPPLIPFSEVADSKALIRTKYKIPEQSKVFLYVGSLKELKRPEIILEAFLSLGREYMEKYHILMLFAGDGPLKNQLIQLCKEHNLEDFFIFMGNVSRNHINEIYKLSDYYIISSDFEGTPISMLEAMYHKLPIIASNVIGINSIIDNNKGLLFNNKNCSTLVAAIKRLVADKERAAVLSENSYSYFIKNFSYHNLIEKYNNIL
jgi:glycosyltransferase involved in cell wall biosynthesis